MSERDAPNPEQLSAKIRPVLRTRAHEEVARQLRELMQHGDLRPNDRLPPERELAKQFDVSRATIRHALSVLEAAGLVESQRGNGTFTRERSNVLNVTDLAGALKAAGSSLVEQLELRRLIEPEVASLAAKRATPADLDVLHECLAEQRHHLADPEFVAADSAFHLGIARASGNKLLVGMVEGIHELLHASRELSWHASGGATPLAQHEAVLAAIAEHDPDAARRAMTEHLLRVERDSLEALAGQANL